MDVQPRVKREQFVVEISCAGCGQTGSVAWEENAAADRAAGSKRALLLLSGGFHLGDAKTQSGDPEIACDYCDMAIAD